MTEDNILKQRIPSKKDTWVLFLACLVPVHLRAYLVFFYVLPSYLLSMTAWGILGIFAYVQIFALVESLFFWLLILLINFTLPRRFFCEKFLSQGIVLLLVLFLWILPLHFQNEILSLIAYNDSLYIVLIVLWLGSFGAAIYGFSRMLRRRVRFEEMVLALGERLMPLAILFFSIDVFSLLVAIVRGIVLS